MTFEWASASPGWTVRRSRSDCTIALAWGEQFPTVANSTEWLLSDVEDSLLGPDDRMPMSELMSELMKAINPKQRAQTRWSRAALMLALSNAEPFSCGDPN
jgi:hypothetical protein